MAIFNAGHHMGKASLHKEPIAHERVEMWVEVEAFPERVD